MVMYGSSASTSLTLVSHAMLAAMSALISQSHSVLFILVGGACMT